jgi:glycosyltransferase involved in cell wall biosynthesis
MLRVLHCIYDDPANPWVGGGGAVRVHELYRRLTSVVETTVMTGSFPGARDVCRHGVRFIRRGASRPYVWSRLTYAEAAMRRLRSSTYDAAVFDFSVYTPIFVPRNRPVGITVHHVTGPTASARWGWALGTAIRAVERRMLARGRYFSATSAATHERLLQVVPTDARITRVGAGVSDELFELRRREQDYLLYFGRLDWFQKGLDILVQAAAKLLAQRPDLTLRVAGRGRDSARVDEAARELGIRDRVELLGPVSDGDRMQLFAGAKLLLMPSRFEGFGMVAAEAMAAGVPIVAAAAGSLPEVIAPPLGGVLVQPGDPAALARAAADLLDDPAARTALSKSARVAAARFRWSTIAEQHLEFLRAVATGS